MNTHLMFYTKSKKCEDYTNLVMFGRSTEMYRYFIDHFKLNSKITPINKEQLREIQNAIATDMYRNKCRLETYEKYAHMNSGLVEEVIGIKEHLGELTQAKMYTDFLMLIIDEAEASYSNLSELACSVA